MSTRVAIVGATGAVGQELLRILPERNFPIGELALLASARSAGKTYEFAGEALTVRETTADSFDGVDVAFFSAGGSISREFAQAAVDAGAVVIDNTSAFRMTDGVPLVVPEVNPAAVRQHSGIIANPNCSTILMNVVVWPLHQAFGVTRVVVSTYQAVSGAGAAGLAELERQQKQVAADEAPSAELFPHPIVDNLFSHNSPIDATGYNEEERKMIRETRKIFDIPDLAVTATCIRVPVPRAHCESVNIEFAGRVTPDQAQDVLSKAPGIKLVDDPTPQAASHQDAVLVGRVRQDPSRSDGTAIDLFLAGDQIRKGAATNAVQVAELL
ncbi:MAG: aspartate-semialdehyde dehydrogenase [Planctomycetota bacterium]